MNTQNKPRGASAGGRRTRSLQVLSVIALAGWVVAVPPRAEAAFLSDSDLFLNPWSVPFDLYPRVYLEPTWDGTNLGNNTYTWSSFNDVVGVNVLPLLRPFSPTQPALYPSGYPFTQADYLYQPNVNYSVDLTGGIAQASFTRPGTYHVVLHRAGGPDFTQAVFVGTGMLPNGELGQHASGPEVDILGPIADLVVVSAPTAGDSLLDKAAANAIDDNGANDVKRANSAGAAVDAIATRYHENHGQKLHVELVAHGNSGLFVMGDTLVGPGGGMSIAQFQAAIDPYVNDLSIYACDFAAGADGRQALQTLANSIGHASGFTVPVTVHRMWLVGYFTGGGWDLDLGGESLAYPPAPGSFGLAFVGVAILLKRRR